MGAAPQEVWARAKLTPREEDAGGGGGKAWCVIIMCAMEPVCLGLVPTLVAAGAESEQLLCLVVSPPSPPSQGSNKVAWASHTVPCVLPATGMGGVVRLGVLVLPSTCG